VYLWGATAGLQLLLACFAFCEPCIVAIKQENVQGVFKTRWALVICFGIIVWASTGHCNRGSQSNVRDQRRAEIFISV